MCWVTVNREDVIPHTAETDMPVYKVLRRNGKTPRMGFDVPIYGEPLPKVEIKFDEYNMISEGYHSYATGVELCDTFNSLDIKLICPEEICLNKSYYYHNCVVHKGYIPKGAKYYMNSNGEIVSETLVITKDIQDCCPSTEMLNVAILKNSKLCFCKLPYNEIENCNVVGIRISVKDREPVYLSLLEEDWNGGKSDVWKNYDEICKYPFPADISAYYNLKEKLGHKIDWNTPCCYNLDNIIYSSPFEQTSIIHVDNPCYRFKIFAVPPSEINKQNPD